MTDIERQRQIALTREWLENFEQAANADPAAIIALGIHPMIVKGMQDAARSQADTIRQELAQLESGAALH